MKCTRVSNRIVLAVLLIAICIVSAADAQVLFTSRRAWVMGTDCSAITTNGHGCYDTDNHTYCLGNGTACAPANPPYLAISGDAYLYRDAANVLAMRNGTAQETIRIYNTGDAWPTHTNYEHMTLTGLAGNSGNMTMQTGGTGGDNLHLVLSGAGTGSVKLRGPSWSRTTTKTVSSTPVTLTTEEICNANVLLTTGASAVNLPAGATTLDGCIATFQTIAKVQVSIDPNSSEIIVLNGTALTGGNKVSNDNSTDTRIGLLYDATATRWRSIGVSGVWSDGGA